MFPGHLASLSSITTVTDEAGQSQDIGIVVAVAVLGTILGLVLIVGTAVLMVFILYRRRTDIHKASGSVLQGMFTIHLCNFAVTWQHIPAHTS